MPPHPSRVGRYGPVTPPHPSSPCEQAHCSSAAARDPGQLVPGVGCRQPWRATGLSAYHADQGIALCCRLSPGTAPEAAAIRGFHGSCLQRSGDGSGRLPDSRRQGWPPAVAPAVDRMFQTCSRGTRNNEGSRQQAERIFNVLLTCWLINWSGQEDLWQTSLSAILRGMLPHKTAAARHSKIAPGHCCPTNSLSLRDACRDAGGTGPGMDPVARSRMPEPRGSG